MRRLRDVSSMTPLLSGIALGLAAVLFLLGIACSSEAAESAPAATTPTEAIAAFVRSTGDTYAGLCEQTSSPADIGKICSRLIDERGSVQAHLIGRTFSEFTTWVFVAEGAGGWSVVASEPLDFHDMTMAIPWPN